MTSASDEGFGLSATLRAASDPPPLDENVAYIESLSPSPRQAYRQALGDGPTADGCYKRSRDAFESEWMVKDALGEARAVVEQAEESPAVMAAESKWSECMHERGFQYDTILEMVNSLFSALEAAENGVAATQSDAALAELHALEVEIAVANHECGVGYRPVRNESLAIALGSVDHRYAAVAGELIERIGSADS